MTFFIAFFMFSMLMQIVTGFSIYSLIFPALNGKSIHSIAENRRMKELSSGEPEYDEWGYRKDYDPHYVRALEIDTGVSVSELTTCSDQDCLTCVPGVTTMQAIESKVNIPSINPRLWNERLTEMEKMVKEEKEEAARIERQVREEAIYHQRYMPGHFRPSNVPKRATAAVEEVKNGAGETIKVIIRWAWDDNIWSKSLTTYEVVYAHGDPYLRKRRPRDKVVSGTNSALVMAEGILAGRLVVCNDDATTSGLYTIRNAGDNKLVGYCYRDTLNTLLMNARMGW